MTEKRSDGALGEGQRLVRRETFPGLGPFRVLERVAQEMDRTFDDFGLWRRVIGARFVRSWRRSPRSDGPITDWDGWTPDIDVVQRNHELIVRADLPGLRKEDVKIEVTDDTIIIQGVRHHDAEEEQGGVYRSERGYGSFSRLIPLPEGAIADQAKASFKDGVLEITMPAPPEQVTRGRRLEITETSPRKSER